MCSFYNLAVRNKEKDSLDKEVPVITIDGPSGVGKGTVSFLLAQLMDWHLLESGTLYRALALAAKQRGVDVNDEAALSYIASYLDVAFKAPKKGERARVLLEGQNCTDIICTEDVGTQASQVSKFDQVRQALLQRQRDFRQMPGLIAEGRDMGTVVFPDATLRFFMIASVHERAKRRFKQLKEKGINVTMECLKQEIAERDERDQNRSVAPLQPADDAIMIDTSGLSVEEVMMRVKTEINRVLNVEWPQDLV